MRKNNTIRDMLSGVKKDCVCDTCGAELKIGDYPFCGPSGHTTVYSRNAQQGDATVVFRNAKGEYRFPGRGTDRIPRGFVKVELTTQRERDRFEREFGAQQTALLREKLHNDAKERDDTFAAHRDNLKRIKENGNEYTKRFVDACLKRQEERERRGPGTSEAGFFIFSNHYRDKAVPLGGEG